MVVEGPSSCQRPDARRDGVAPCRVQRLLERPRGRTRLKVAYLGLTCEAPLFVTQAEGFYEEEGLDVKLVKTDWDALREGLGTGRRRGSWPTTPSSAAAFSRPLPRSSGRDPFGRLEWFGKSLEQRTLAYRLLDIYSG